MQVRNPLAHLPTVKRRRARLAFSAVAVTAATLGGGLLATALPAYADVTTNAYTIGAPSGAVGAVTASPSAVGEGALTNFAVTFEVPSALSGPSSDSVTVTPSTTLASAPTNIDIVGGSCIQAGTAGVGGAGSAAPTGLTIELSSNCSLSAGQKVEVDFSADAPSSTGTMHFNVATSKNTTPGSSNSVTVSTAGPQLTAASVEFGVNTTYSVTDVPVANVSAEPDVAQTDGGRHRRERSHLVLRWRGRLFGDLRTIWWRRHQRRGDKRVPELGQPRGYVDAGQRGVKRRHPKHHRQRHQPGAQRCPTVQPGHCGTGERDVRGLELDRVRPVGNRRQRLAIEPGGRCVLELRRQLQGL